MDMVFSNSGIIISGYGHSHALGIISEVLKFMDLSPFLGDHLIIHKPAYLVSGQIGDFALIHEIETASIRLPLDGNILPV